MKFSLFFPTYCYSFVDRDSSVGIATRYGLDSPGIDPVQYAAEDLRELIRPLLGYD
jgi:hypothetical protein